MHMRFVRLKGKEEKTWDAKTFFEERVFPQLEQIDGCLFVGLLQGTIHGDDYVSMTLWTSADAAAVYEQSGVFDRLLDESDEVLQEAEEWTTNLPGEDGAVVFSGIEPEVDAWDVASIADEQILERISEGRIFVRLVAARLRSGAFDEFQAIFEKEVSPVLASTSGCIGSFLVAGAADQTRILSVTMWAREEDAVRYSLSGEFDRLTARLKDTFSDLYQWNVALSGEPELPSSTGNRSPDVEGYQMVIGRKLK